MHGIAVLESLHVGDTLDVTNVMYEPGTALGDYFDGATVGAAWDGTVGKSSSTYSWVVTRSYMQDARGAFRGAYSSTGVTYNALDYPEGGDTCAVFAPGAGAAVQAGTDAWNFSTFEYISSSQADIAAVGSLVSVEGTGTNTIAVDPGPVGNVLILSVRVNSSTNDIASISGGGVDTWMKVGPSEIVSGSRSLSIWMGVVTDETTGSQTITLTGQTALTSVFVNIAVQEFSSSVGVDTVWLVDGDSDGLNNTLSGDNVPFPTLTPDSSKRAYVGYSYVSAAGQLTGQTAGYTVQLAVGSNPFIYNTNVSTVQSPMAHMVAAGVSTTIGFLLSAFRQESPGRGTWGLEFLARLDGPVGAGGAQLFHTDKWEIVLLPGGSLTFRQVGSTGPTVPSAWTQDVWSHYVISFNGEGLTFYVDGEDVNTFFNTDIEGLGASTLYFAGNGDNPQLALDEVAVYTQFLNDGRVTAHYLGISQIFGEYPTAARIQPPLITFNFDAGQTDKLMIVLVQHADGSESSPLNVVWSVTDPTVVEIDENGLLSAVAPGSSGITAVMPDLGVSAIAGATVLTPEFLPSDFDRQVYSDDSQHFVYEVNPITFEKQLVATTHEYWEIDQGRLLKGQWIYDTPIPLSTLAYNISTLAGREGIPVSDTENVRIATRPGRRWIPKTPEQKQLTFAMWVLGADTEGRFPSDIYMRTRFWENYNKLKQLFAVWDRQLLLTRRTPTRFGIQKMYTFVEPVSRMDLNPTGPMRATFSIDLVMADPFWFGPELKTDPTFVRAEGGLRNYPRTYRLVYSAHGAPGIVLVNNEGTHDAKLKAVLRGPFKNPMLTDVETRESFRLVPDVPIEKGTYVVIDFWEKSILLNGQQSRYWWMDRNTDWLKMRPGYTRFRFTHEGWDEDSTVEWQWRPSYL
jgi:hypothetical protein